jgi:hypothetical protein
MRWIAVLYIGLTARWMRQQTTSVLDYHDDGIPGPSRPTERCPRYRSSASLKP